MRPSARGLAALGAGDGASDGATDGAAEGAAVGAAGDGVAAVLHAPMTSAAPTATATTRLPDRSNIFSSSLVNRLTNVL
jgi:hypothetical protein